MATIGSDGKEDSKDGKDDCGQITGFTTLGLNANLSLTANNLPVERRFYRAEITGVGGVPEDVQKSSDDYWNQAVAMGLLDSATTKAGGNTTLIIAASSEDEARTLAEGDPIIAGGLVNNLALSQV